MAKSDPTEPIRKKAATFPDAVEGTSCKQTSFKVGKVAFLYLGPGAKGQGFKAMFKLDGSRAQAEKLSAKEPDRYQVGSVGWVTTRFTADKPLPKTVWEKWLKESYAVTCGSGAAGGKKPAAKKTAKKTAASKRG